jgi:hypothetical protein
MKPENVGVVDSASIKYTEGYKYQTEKDLNYWTPLRPSQKIDIQFITLDTDGLLTIKKGYAWDGASGPTIDTPNTMFGSCVHDALYQLMRAGLLAPHLRVVADVILWKLIRRDGMGSVRAYWWHRAVKNWAAKAASHKSRRKVLVAP